MAASQVAPVVRVQHTSFVYHRRDARIRRNLRIRAELAELLWLPPGVARRGDGTRLTDGVEVGRVCERKVRISNSDCVILVSHFC